MNASRVRKFLKKSSAIIVKTIVAFLMVVLAYGAAVIFVPLIPVNSTLQTGDIAIYLRTNGVHTDIVVPAKTTVFDWTAKVKYNHVKISGEPKYLAMGWGDRDFYLNTPSWDDLSFKTAFNAAFYLGSTIVHTEYEYELRESETCKKIMISPQDYGLLVTFLLNTFQFDASQNLIWIPNSGYGDNDTFYVAHGKYSLFKTCNSWTNSALKSANQTAALWTATDTGIMRHYK